MQEETATAAAVQDHHVAKDSSFYWYPRSVVIVEWQNVISMSRNFICWKHFYFLVSKNFMSRSLFPKCTATSDNIRPYIVPTILAWNCRSYVEHCLWRRRCSWAIIRKAKRINIFFCCFPTTTTERVHTGTYLRILLVLPPTWSRWKFCHHGWRRPLVTTTSIEYRYICHDCIRCQVYQKKYYTGTWYQVLHLVCRVLPGCHHRYI